MFHCWRAARSIEMLNACFAGDTHGERLAKFFTSTTLNLTRFVLVGPCQFRDHLEPAAVHPRRQLELRGAEQLGKPGLQHDLPTIPLQHTLSLDVPVVE